MCVEDERVNVFQDMFSFCGYCDVWIHFFEINAWVRCLQWKGWNILLSTWSFLDVGEHSMVFWLLEKLHHVCSQRQCDALGIGIRFYKRPTAEQWGFQPQLWFPFLDEDGRHPQRQPPENLVVLLEELIFALCPACTDISNEWFPSTCLIGLFRPGKSLIPSLQKGDPLFKGSTLENARSGMGWCLGHLSLHQISLVGEHGKGEAWEQWVAIKCPDFSEILGFLEITSTLWSHWK